MIFCKCRRTITAQRCPQNIAIEPRITNTSEERKLVAFPFIRTVSSIIYVWRKPEIIVLQHIGGQVKHAKLVIVSLAFVISCSQNSVQIMTSSKLLIEGKIFLHAVIIVISIGISSKVLLYLLGQARLCRRKNITVFVGLINAELHISLQPRCKFHL